MPLAYALDAEVLRVLLEHGLADPAGRSPDGESASDPLVLRQNERPPTFAPFELGDVHVSSVETYDEPSGTPVVSRIYRPRLDGRIPTLFWLHGGGFAAGTLSESSDHLAQLATRLRCQVIVPAYRLAPEHRYPCGLDNARAALRHCTARPDLFGIDPHRVSVGGASAGGALAATLGSDPSVWEESRIRPASVVLLYPVLDDRLQSWSAREFRDTPIFNRAAAQKMWDLYLGGVEADGDAAPARRTDLSGAPPTLVVACEFDPLRDEAIAYASRLLESRVPTGVCILAGSVHSVDTVAPSTRIAGFIWQTVADHLGRAWQRGAAFNSE